MGAPTPGAIFFSPQQGAVVQQTGSGNNTKPLLQPNQAQAASTPQTSAAPTNTTGSSTYTNPALSTYYGDAVNQIKSILSALPTQQGQGVANIQNSSNASLNALNTGESQTLSDIANKENEANFNKVQSLNDVDNNVADTIASYRRLVAAGHAGDSAFATQFVPMATAQQGTGQRQSVFNSYGQDMAGLETSKNNAQTQYGQNQADILAKRNSDIVDFLNSLQDQKDQLNQQASQDAAYSAYYGGQGGAAVNSAVTPFNTSGADRIAALKAVFAQYANPTYTVNPVTVTTPDLSTYTQDPLQAQLSTQPGNSSTPLASLPFATRVKDPTTATSTTAS